MKLLEEKIANEGLAIGTDILKVDMFLNHQMDIALMEQIGREFKRRFGCEIETVYGDVMKRLVSQGVLAEAAGRVFLTTRGIDVSNVVLAEFLLDEFVRR